MYSHSKISCFFNCPLQFRFKYIDKTKVEEFESIESFLGKCAHAALEKLYHDQKNSKTNALEDILGFYKEHWQKNYKESIRIIKQGYTQDNYFRLGRKYIEDFYNKNFPFNESATVGLEQKITLELNGHTIIGYIDRLAIGKDATYEIHDYKTSKSMPQMSHFQKDEQLALYALAVKSAYNDAAKIRLIWHYLAFNKAINSSRTEKEFEEAKSSVIKKIEIIEGAITENNFLPKASQLCSWCEFQKICPQHNMQFTMENKKHDELHEKTEKELVDEYVELKNKQMEIAEKADKIKDELVKYCKLNNVTSARGSEYMANVHAIMATKYPGSDEESRKKLEMFLKENKLWDRVSTLDIHALKRLVTETLLDKKITEKIRSFETEETTHRVMLSKRKD